MKVERSGALVRQVWRLASLSLAIVVLVAVGAACGGDDGEEPTGTGTAAATGSPSATVVGTAAPQGTTVASGEAPGISDTEILLGAECILSGSMGAVYSTIPKTVSAYFNYINETEGGVCGRKIVYKVEDNTDDPARGVEVARKLVEQDKVFAMVGSPSSSSPPHAMATAIKTTTAKDREARRQT